MGRMEGGGGEASNRVSGEERPHIHTRAASWSEQQRTALFLLSFGASSSVSCQLSLAQSIPLCHIPIPPLPSLLHPPPPHASHTPNFSLHPPPQAKSKVVSCEPWIPALPLPFQPSVALRVPHPPPQLPSTPATHTHHSPFLDPRKSIRFVCLFVCLLAYCQASFLPFFFFVFFFFLFSRGVPRYASRPSRFVNPPASSTPPPFTPSPSAVSGATSFTSRNPTPPPAPHYPLSIRFFPRTTLFVWWVASVFSQRVGGVAQRKNKNKRAACVARAVLLSFTLACQQHLPFVKRVHTPFGRCSQ